MKEQMIIVMLICVIWISLADAKELPKRASEKKQLAYQIASTGDVSGYSPAQVQELLKYIPPSKKISLEKLHLRNLKPACAPSEPRLIKLPAQPRPVESVQQNTKTSESKPVSEFVTLDVRKLKYAAAIAVMFMLLILLFKIFFGSGGRV